MERLSAIPFYFLRHGETDWNAQGLSQGRTEVPLNDAGLAQAGEAAERLKNCGIRSIVASTLGRAQRTASIVGQVLGLGFSSDAGLQETSFGDQEGLKMGSWYDDWVAGNYTPVGGETFAALRARVVQAINRALERPGPVLIVAHGAMFRAVRAEMGLSPLVRAENGIPQYCQPGTPWLLSPVQ